MASSQSPVGNVDLFDLYFQRADLDRDGRISGAEAVTFFQGSGLPKPVLAQVWAFANVRQADFLGRAEFYNALKLVTVAQSNRQLTPDIVKAALYSPAAAKIPAPKINVTTTQPLPGSSASAAPKPPLPTPTTASQPMQGTATQGFPRGGVAAGPRPPTPNISNEWAAGSTVGAPTGTSLQVQNKGTTSSMGLGGFGLTTLGSTTSLPSTSQPTSGTKSLGTVIKDTNNANVSGNGFASESFFGGDVFSATPVKPKQDASANTFSARSLPASPALVPNSSGTQPSVRPSTFDSVQRSATTPIPVRQFQPAQSVVRPDKVSAPSSPSIPGVAPASGQSQVPWPKMTQIDAQKYMKVFVEVDTDKDGKITGEQARNLFLSWRLPREVLKQVWDLSDQDNDSMLSFKEFCIALYLMERYREGRTIPAALPSNVIVEVSSFVQPAPNAGNAAWRQSGVQQHAGGFQQQQNVSATGPRPPLPRPFAVPQADDESKVSQPKSRVPELEKHLIDQLSTEEQNSLNLKFKEATEAEKKVEELEKEILESRQKIEFFGSKMQELVLYKSRCDNRLNEIMERSSVDKKEAESLAKKYEEKYKQTGDVASKLTIEEATFRDMQEKKMELYRAIVKLEQGSDSDIQERADKIQSDLDELVRALNERCKKYGLRGKPITLTELPFGWQPGIQAGAADWDEDWDKFEDEGFFFVKELTLDVQNVIAPPKEKFVLPQKKEPSSVESPKAISSWNGDVKLDKPDNVDERIVENGSHSKSEDLAKNAPSSPMGPNSPMGPTSPLGPNSPMGPTSPMGSNSPIGTSSYIGSPSGEFSYSNFDKTFGSDASPRAKETQSDHGGAGSLFSSDKGFDEPAWGTYDMNDDIDSVWGFNASSSTIKDTDHERNDYFFGSEDFGLNPIRTGTTQSSSFSQSNRTFNFDDSVPSTPLYNTGNSPPGYKDSSEPSFDSFSRFDSFRTYDSGFLPKDTFSRFDSMRGSRDFDQSHGFPPLDDSDPFGSSGPFRKSLDSQTPRKSPDSWNAF